MDGLVRCGSASHVAHVTTILRELALHEGRTSYAAYGARAVMLPGGHVADLQPANSYTWPLVTSVEVSESDQLKVLPVLEACYPLGVYCAHSSWVEVAVFGSNLGDRDVGFVCRAGS